MTEPKILLLDIETSPIIGYTWTVYEANVIKVIEPSRVMCVSFKWLNDPEVVTYDAEDDEEKNLLKFVRDVLDEAEVIVAHNGDQFDIKKLNTRFIRYNIPPPSPFKTVDTLKSAKKFFKFESNSLDNLGGYLDEGRKASTGGFKLWEDCLAGDPEAWQKMRDYNVADVLLLEKVYLRLRPYISNHPSVVTPNAGVCPSCSSSRTQKRGWYYTSVARKQRYVCLDCRSWSLGAYERNK